MNRTDVLSVMDAFGISALSLITNEKGTGYNFSIAKPEKTIVDEQEFIKQLALFTFNFVNESKGHQMAKAMVFNADEQYTADIANEDHMPHHHFKAMVRAHVALHEAAQHGLEKLKIEFHGSADEGGVEQVTFLDSEGNEVDVSEMGLDYLDDVADELLDELFGSAWYDGNGIGGELVFDFANLSLNGDYEEYNEGSELTTTNLSLTDCVDHTDWFNHLRALDIVELNVCYQGSDDESDGFQVTGKLKEGGEAVFYEKDEELATDFLTSLLNSHHPDCFDSNRAYGDAVVDLDKGTLTLNHNEITSEQHSLSGMAYESYVQETDPRDFPTSGMNG